MLEKLKPSSVSKNVIYWIILWSKQSSLCGDRSNSIVQTKVTLLCFLAFRFPVVMVDHESVWFIFTHRCTSTFRPGDRGRLISYCRKRKLVCMERRIKANTKWTRKRPLKNLCTNIYIFLLDHFLSSVDRRFKTHFSFPSEILY